MNGWVKLHRKMLDNPVIMKDAEHLAVWTYLLLNATHEDYPALFKGKKIVLEPGQLITGRKAIASALAVNESKVRRILDAFEIDQQIDRQRSNQNTLISLKNWEKYQVFDQQIDQQSTNDRPTTDQRPTTNKNIKNDKNVKNERNNIPPISPKGGRAKTETVYYPDDEKLNQAFADFVEMRKKIKKPMTDRAITLAMNKLKKLSAIPFSDSMDNDLAIQILEQSTMNCWQDLYPLKDNGNKRSSSSGVDWDNV